MKYVGAGIVPADILLPRPDVYPTTWACVACDQYTSEPEYWEDVALQVGDAPSTLRIILPEVWLGEADARIPAIHAHMRQYLDAVLTRTVHGFILTARTTQSGCRKGLMLAIDLEQYDFSAGSRSRVRATEGTILSRISPRQKVRRGAPLESPHVMLLIDDKHRTLIEPLYEKLHGTSPLYDAELHQDMGHLTGWAVQDEADLAAVEHALLALDAARGDAPLFAVGDGNHSLATAKACWEELKPTLSPEEQLTHPARYALVELENIHDPAQAFEPIHRVIFNTDTRKLLDTLRSTCCAEGGYPVQWYIGSESGTIYLDRAKSELAVGVLQTFLDEYLKENPGEIDYIHDDDALISLAAKENAIGFLLPAMEKSQLFRGVIADGVLPRKTFSMGHSREKRYYLEGRRIK